MASERVAIIVNPISGTGGQRDLARRRVAHAEAALASHHVRGRVFITESGSHAATLARQALADGVGLVIAWGGDGTINDVASQLVFENVAFAVIPSGSGNGLARELKIPCNADRAFAVAFGRDELLIDAGEIEGRLFFNVAGIGIDAQIAHEFAVNGLVRRGFRRYLEIGARQLFTYRPVEHSIDAGGRVIRTRPLVVAIANGRQYGNGALIAPGARIDDGSLDLIVVEHRSALKTLTQVPMLFAGRIANLSGVQTARVTELKIASATPVLYHVDGEPCTGATCVTARVHPRALRVRVPSPL